MTPRFIHVLADKQLFIPYRAQCQSSFCIWVGHETFMSTNDRPIFVQIICIVLTSPYSFCDLVLINEFQLFCLTSPYYTWV